jgi:uncharacterized protein involved in exopolysaccharide biosynthesis
MTTTVTTQVNEDISIRDIAADIRSAKLYILATMVFLSGLGAATGFLRDKQYESTTVVAPVSGESSRLGGLGALASQFGDLASLAGVSTPTASKKNEAVAVLQSELLTEAYIKSQNLLPVLLRDTSWLSAHLGRFRATGKDRAPTLWKANQYFKKNVRSVTEDKSTGLITLRISWKDPQLAAKWANDLVKITNTYLRDKAIREAERNISYLNEQALNTNILEARQAIYSLLKGELDNEMLARGRDEYALKVIDPAFPPEKPASLGATALGIFGLAAGFVLSILVIVGIRVVRNAL